MLYGDNVDYIFQNFYIPPVIFAANVHEDGFETKTCIDGKQRLTSIHKSRRSLLCQSLLNVIIIFFGDLWIVSFLNSHEKPANYHALDG